MSLWIGLAACFGLSLIANFQLSKGAISCFGLGTIYFWFQGFITHYVQSYMGSTSMTFARFGMALLCTISFTTTLLTSYTTIAIFFNQIQPKSDNCHLKDISAFAEWITATTFCFFILSFTNEFTRISLERLIILVIRKTSITLCDISSGSSQNLLI